MRTRIWLHRAGGALLLLVAFSAGVSLTLRSRRAHRYLVARLEAAFGRPVEVSRFGFSLLDGLRLQANHITVAEDPRFGYEYFLRAERLAAGLRLHSLLLGRFEFGTLSLSRPTLNLVRGADGHWNVESWLPPPAPGPGVVPPPRAVYSPARLYRIEVDGGRINFKRGPDKHPLALVDVRGDVEQESAGRWRMDLEARPFRAAVTLQEAGTLRLRGRIAGTSVRLRPAELELTWEDASLADALRLARGRDFGMRGKLSVEVTARSAAPGEPSAHSDEAPGSSGEAADDEGTESRWSLSARARLSSVHRWDLPPRAGDPRLNLIVEALLRPSAATVEISKCVLDAPQSNASAVGDIEWATGISPQFHVLSSGISLADALAWYRAFRPGVTEDVALEGHVGVDVSVKGWPLGLAAGELASTGARLRAATLPQPIGISRFGARVERGRLVLEPASIAMPASAPAKGEMPGRSSNSFRLLGVLGPGAGAPSPPGKDWGFELKLEGQTERAQDLLAAARALGHPFRRGWNAEGAASLRLDWHGTISPYAASTIGTIDLEGLEVRAVYLNRPLTIGSARFELRPDERRVTLDGVEAFGARWKGKLRRPNVPVVGGLVSPPVWEFDLSADRISAVELDRWLGPRARPGFFQRMVPFAAATPNAAGRDDALEALRGQGRLSVDEVTVSPLVLRHLRAEVQVAGRAISLRRAQADFYGGKVEGSLDARLMSEPRYHFQARFDRVNLGALAGATVTLRERFSGGASGELDVVARGIGRENLLRTLEGRGTIRLRDAELRGFDLRATDLENSLRWGRSRFTSAEGAFSMANGKIKVEQLRLTNRAEGYQAKGSVDFSRRLDLEIEPAQRQENGGAPGAAHNGFRITGPLDAPQWMRPEPPLAQR